MLTTIKNQPNVTFKHKQQAPLEVACAWIVSFWFPSLIIVTVQERAMEVKVTSLGKLNLDKLTGKLLLNPINLYHSCFFKENPTLNHEIG
ncbi:MAG: hypothetical protein HC903_08670 [Methylacidiphilales bacterium]|nr:hypothetical protein [Candidatus Methylacidiphilales bacterium]